MSDSQLCPADFNYEILPCESHPDFDDSTRFKKVEFPSRQDLLPIHYCSWFLHKLQLTLFPIRMFSVFQKASMAHC